MDSKPAGKLLENNNAFVSKERPHHFRLVQTHRVAKCWSIQFSWENVHLTLLTIHIE